MRLEFESHPDCTMCPLHEQCSYPGTATRFIGDLPELPEVIGKHWKNLQLPERGHDQALVVVGEAPGRDEDAYGVPYVGWTGRLLHRWVTETYGFTELADVYLTNAVRCYPPDNPTEGQCNKCRKYLLQDLEKIYAAYDKVTVLTMGAKSTKSLTGKSIKKSLVFQGSTRIPKPSSPCKGENIYETDIQVPIFSTYHPGALAPGRSPEQIHVIDSHLRLVKAHLEGKESVATQPVVWETSPDSINAEIPVISIDIETYGILGREQTVFHPRRMENVDNVPPKEQVVCCAMSWLEDGEIRNGFWNLYKPAHRTAFRAALRSLGHATLVGMNTAFDITCLRLAPLGLSKLLTPANFDLDDLSITNHLVADLRPERSLKSISRLLGRINYEDLVVSTVSGGHAAINADDPNLARYNVIDTVNTLSIYLDNLETLRAREPENSLVDWSTWRSDLVWTTCHMQEHGMRFDRKKLQEIEDHAIRQRDRSFAVAAGRGLLLGGKGSEASILGFLHDCLDEAGLWDDRRLKMTKKTNRVSTGKENIGFLEGALPVTSPLRRKLKLLTRYRRSSKLVSSYTKKLLHTPAQGCDTNGMAYPSWFPVPAFVKDDYGTEGGTKQGRFAAHNPPAQTCPPIIKKAMMSRYPGGVLWSWDLSQVELRVLALLSGDPAMMQSYINEEDIHWETAREFWPDLPPEKPDVLTATQHERRALGKTANFLIVYRGGAHKLQETARRQLRLEITRDFAEYCIQKIKEARPQIFEFQDRLIADVKKKGYIELLTGWRRTFFANGYAIEKSSVNEICNMPIQTYGAQILQSIQWEFLRWRAATKTTCVVPAQIHDDIHVDMPKSSEETVLREMDTLMKEPPFWTALCEHVDRWIPLDYGRELLYA